MTVFQEWLRSIGAAEIFEFFAKILPDAAIFVVDKDRSIVFWSDGAEKLLGFRRDDVLRQHCLKGIRCAACLSHCTLSSQRSLFQGISHEMFLSDGSSRLFRRGGQAFFDSEGCFIGGIEVISPVSSGSGHAVSHLPAASSSVVSSVQVAGSVSHQSSLAVSPVAVDSQVSPRSSSAQDVSVPEAPFGSSAVALQVSSVSAPSLSPLGSSRAGVSVVSRSDVSSVVSLDRSVSESRTGLVASTRDEPRVSSRTVSSTLASPRVPSLFHGLYSLNPRMQQIFSLVQKTADRCIMFQGESGVGKKSLARALHEESDRRDGPFVVLPCAGLLPDVLDAESVFSAPTRLSLLPRPFSAAEGGTLVLEELSLLPIPLQRSLLRVLEERSYSAKPLRGLRLVVCNTRDLEEEARAGRVAPELLRFLHGIHCHVPPLRSRLEDLEGLVSLFLPKQPISEDALSLLRQYTWPGNLRELQSLLKQSASKAHGRALGVSELPRELWAFSTSSSLPPRSQYLDPPMLFPLRTEHEAEAEEIEQALQRHGGRVSEAAASLGMSRPTFWRKRKKYNL